MALLQSSDPSDLSDDDDDDGDPRQLRGCSSGPSDDFNDHPTTKAMMIFLQRSHSSDD